MELFKENDATLKALEARPTGAGPGGPTPEFNEEAVSPEEQSIYDQFVLRAKEQLTKSPEAAIDSMNRKNMPVYESVGRTGLMLAEEIAGAAKARGTEISADIMFHGGQEIVEMLMELGDSAGIFPFKQDSKEYDEAMTMAFYHGVQTAGNAALQGEGGAAMTEEAGNILAREIAGEEERGEVAPGFWEGLKGQVATKV